MGFSRKEAEEAILEMAISKFGEDPIKMAQYRKIFAMALDAWEGLVEEGKRAGQEFDAQGPFSFFLAGFSSALPIYDELVVKCKKVVTESN